MSAAETAMRSAFLVGIGFVLFVGCWTPSDNSARGPEAGDVPGSNLTPELLRRRGFAETEKGIWDIDHIKFGELCDLVGGSENQFAFRSNSQPGSGLDPLEYDGGHVRALAYLPSNEPLTEEGFARKEWDVKATVIIYDETHPRPKGKLIYEPGKKPKLEREP
jgi:hypothetical protein